MTIIGKINRVGGECHPYEPGSIVFNGSNGLSATINFKKGIYYVRGQGGGAGGGNNVYAGNGGGGGSGAGFEGYLYFTEDMSVQVGTASGVGTQANGNNTFITNVMVLNGGKAGGTDNNQNGLGGIFQLSHDPITGKVRILSSTKRTNGNPGGKNAANLNANRGGADSVLTNNGGGWMGGNRTQRNATMPGAGGAGGHSWDSAGGNGAHGELLIKYIRARI